MLIATEFTFAASACGSNENPAKQRSSTATPAMTGQPTNRPTSQSPMPTMEYLSDMDPLTSTRGVDTGAVEVNGRGFPRSVTLWVNAAGPVSEAEYNLGRHWKKFTATAGLRDDSPTGGKLTFEVSADGRSIFKKQITLGESRDVDLNVDGALRLKLTVTYSGQDSGSSYNGTWGDARIEGP
ncbi:NPCBM/NEW2 domain-containing protein [Streptomyces lydicus]|uniref:NPCBM/NEW2 domain-containing protein n=1 Tax=Streptomyces lydicus TaxID=47763 RepID=UPI0036913246